MRRVVGRVGWREIAGGIRPEVGTFPYSKEVTTWPLDHTTS